MVTTNSQTCTGVAIGLVALGAVELGVRVHVTVDAAHVALDSLTPTTTAFTSSSAAATYSVHAISCNSLFAPYVCLNLHIYSIFIDNIFFFNFILPCRMPFIYLRKSIRLMITISSSSSQVITEPHFSCTIRIIYVFRESYLTRFSFHQ